MSPMNEITNKSGLPPINEIMSPRRVARMEAGVPANAALHLMIDSHEGT